MNVIWILGEGIRNYSGKDQYSRFKVMDQLALEGIIFNNMVTSAPSTIMAQSSMLTGQSSTYLSRTFADFKYDSSKFSSLTKILKENDYHIYTALFHIEGCTLFKEMLPLLDQKHLPPKIKNDMFWTSEDVNLVLDHLLDQKLLQEPFFLLLNYNNTSQEDTNEIIERAIKRMKEKGIYDNSLFLFCPDHGHPDNPRNNTLGKPHGMVLTDANILIPFFIRWPHCQQKVINQPISTLDIVPTVLDLLNISALKYDLEGTSLLPSIMGEADYSKTKFRVDTKYIFQEGRAICIYSSEFKYIFHPDKPMNEGEEFFNLNRDPDEKDNQILSKEYAGKIKEFREEFKKTEEELENFHLNYLVEKFKQKFSSFLNQSFLNQNNSRPSKVLLLGLGHSLFLQSIFQALNESFTNPDIGVVIESESILEKIGVRDKVNFYQMNLEQKQYDHTKSYANQLKNPFFSKYSGKVSINYKSINYHDLLNKHPDLLNQNYDLVIAPLDNPYGVGHQTLVQLIKQLKTKKVMYVDYNVNTKKPTNWFWGGLRLVYLKKNYYLRDTKRLLMEVRRYLKDVVY